MILRKIMARGRGEGYLEEEVGFFFNIYLFIQVSVAALGSRCVVWDLSLRCTDSELWCAGSVLVAV